MAPVQLRRFVTVGAALLLTVSPAWPAQASQTTATTTATSDVGTVAAAGTTGTATATTTTHDVVATVGIGGALWVHDAAGWASRGGLLVDSPVVVPAPHGGVWYIGVGDDHDVWLRSDTEGWRPHGLGARCGGVGALVSGSSLVVACRGLDGAVWWGTWEVPEDGSLPTSGTSMTSLGGQVENAVTVTAEEGQVTFVVDGRDDRAWYRTLASDWQLAHGSFRCSSGPSAPPGGSPVACDQPDATLAVLFPATGESRLLGGRVHGRPGAVPSGAYALGTDGAVWRLQLDGVSDFDRLGGTGWYGVGAATVG